MHKKKIVYYILFLLVFCTHYAEAKNKDIGIILDIRGELSIEKELLNLSQEMEQDSDINQVVGNKIYLESEVKKSFYKLLHSYGYYKSRIYFNVIQPNLVSLIIVAGERYKISRIGIEYVTKSNKQIRLPDIKNIGIAQGDYLNVKQVLVEEKKISKFIEENNCLLSLDVRHKAKINQKQNSIEILFEIDAGEEATISVIKFTGLKNVNANYARKLLKIKDNTCFKREYIENATSELQKTGLFASTIPSIPKKSNENGEVPITFNVTERNARSIKSGVSYSTDLGIGGMLGWEHRNFFGAGEELRSEISGNKKEKTFSVGYIKPFFIQDNQTLKASTQLQNRKLKAFYSKESSTSVFLERRISKEWDSGLGLKYSYSDVQNISNNKSDQTYSLISIPAFLNKDTRDSILDPKKGYNARLEVAPFTSTKSKESSFLKSKLELSTYLTSDIKLTPTIALKIGSGSIYGNKANNIPVTERFYLGGSYSIRGYAYQLVGPLDEQNRPIGGNNFIDTSAELRLRFTDTIGIVSFIDGGYVYNSDLDKKKQKILYSYGFGARYMTGFGPIRLDIGFPINRRKGIDKSFQVYFGIGQSF